MGFLRERTSDREAGPAARWISSALPVPDVKEEILVFTLRPLLQDRPLYVDFRHQYADKTYVKEGERFSTRLATFRKF